MTTTRDGQSAMQATLYDAEGRPISAENPLLVQPAGAVTIKQTVVTLAAGADTVVVQPSAARQGLAIVNVGTGLAAIDFDKAAVIGQSWPLAAAASAGAQGGSASWRDGAPVNTVRGVSAAGTTLLVQEAIRASGAQAVTGQIFAGATGAVSAGTVGGSKSFTASLSGARTGYVALRVGGIEQPPRIAVRSGATAMLPLVTAGSTTCALFDAPSGGNLLDETAAFAVTSGITVGGLAIGAAGAAGSIYDGFVLADGDDFDTLSAADFVRPGNNAGTLMTPRNYGIQSSAPRYNRGAGSLGGYNVDPWHTGFRDANRGVAVAEFADSISFAGGSMKLKARRASANEMAKFGPLGSKTLISTSVHLGRRNFMRAPCMIECSMRVPYYFTDWSAAAYHPTFWLIQGQPGNGWDGLELDAEGFSPNFIFNRNTWANGVGQYGASLGQTNGVSKTVYKTYTFKVAQDGQGVWTAYLYEGGTLLGSGPCDYGGSTFDPTKPFLFMWTNHILQSGLTQAQWDAAGADGASMDVDWWRAWRPAAGKFRKPLVQQPDLLADFAAPFSFTLPSAATVWGSDVTSDVLESIQNEDNGAGKGIAGTTLWRGLLPDGVTRTGDVLAGTISDQPGRLILARSATPAAGDGCQLQPVTLCIGPVVRTAGPLAWYTGVAITPWDVYADCDCGDLHVGKIVSVSGLPAGLSYSISTGLVSGAPTATGTGTVVVSVTNGVGQVASKTLSYSVTTLAVPVFSAAPVITGVMAVGQTLTATDGTWSPTPDGYVRQWLADGVAISGATGPSYVLTSAELGKRIGFRSAGYNAAGTGTATTSTQGYAVVAAATGRSWLAWNTLLGDFDAGNAAQFAAASGGAEASGDQAAWQNGAGPTKGVLRSIGTAPTLSRVASGTPSGRAVMRSVRGGGPTNNSVMETLASDPIAQALVGTNKDFTLIVGANFSGGSTSLSFGWSESTASYAHVAAIVRRAGSASSVRYGQDSSADVNIGTIANGWAIIAWRHQAGKSTVWVNSATTKAVDAVDHVGGLTFNAATTFSVGNTHAVGGDYSSTGLAGDAGYVVSAGSARSDAEIVAAIQDMATILGLTLS